MKLGLIFLAAVFAVSYLLGSLLDNNKQVDSIVTISTCNLLDGSCHVVDKGIEYKLAFEGTPSPLTPFYIRVSELSSQPSKVEVKFEMDGMDMGKNYYFLDKKEKYWGAKVLLPVCSLGRNDWVLRVNILYKEKVYSTDFKFSQ